MIIVKGKDNAPATAPPATVLSTSASIKGTLSVDSVSSCLPEAYTAPPAVVATTVSTVGDHLASWFTLFLVFTNLFNLCKDSGNLDIKVFTPKPPSPFAIPKNPPPPAILPTSSSPNAELGFSLA